MNAGAMEVETAIEGGAGAPGGGAPGGNKQTYKKN